MNLPISKRQKDLLSIIYNHIKDEGYPPTFEEMREGLGVTSNQSVVDLLNKLHSKKLIKRNESSARSLAILPLGYEVLGKKPLIPFLGVTHAGIPIETIEINGEWQEISGGMEKLNSNIFLLKVSGDSMINAGIDDEDKVLIQEQKEYHSGDIVLADVNGESTIKRFISDDKPPYLYLKPENPSYPNITFTSTVELKGKVISIIKNANN